jgi:hypothetical protein
MTKEKKESALAWRVLLRLSQAVMTICLLIAGILFDRQDGSLLGADGLSFLALIVVGSLAFQFCLGIVHKAYPPED